MALRSFDLSLNGFSGVDDRITEERAPGALVAMENGCLAGTGLERSAQVRPGIRAPAVGLVSAGRVGQLVTDFVTNIGTRVNVIVYSGEICRSTDGGGNYAVAVSSANFTTAGITVSATRRWYAVAFNGKLIISDGANRPFSYDGTTGAGAVASLTNAPAVVRGAPTTHGGKVFFIKSDKTIVWSEEFAENTGYEAGGYNNAWTLGQTEDDPIYTILGSNEGLYFIRPNSIGIVRGAVTTDFSQASTQDAISMTLGSRALTSAVLTDNHLLLQDSFGRPWAIPRGGGEPLPIWQAFSRVFSPGAGQPFNNDVPWFNPQLLDGGANIAFSHDLGIVLFALPTALVGTTRPEWTSMLVYDTSTLQAWGAWTVGQTINAFGGAYVMSGGALHAGLVYAGINGRVGVQSVILGSSASDNITGSEVRPPFVIWGPILPPKLKGNLYFQRLDVFATAPVLASGSTLGHLSYSLQYLTSLRPYRSNLSPAQAVWRRETDVSYISFRYVPTKASFGLNGYGRWILPVLTITEVDGSGNAVGPWGAVIQGCRIEALVADAEPNAE